jgi:hypothetical protein
VRGNARSDIPGLGDCAGACVGIGIGQHRLEVRPETWTLFEIIAQPLPVLEERVEPTSRTPLRLEFVLQQMEEHDDEIALDGLLVIAAHPFDLFEQVGDVQLVQALLAQ